MLPRKKKNTKFYEPPEGDDCLETVVCVTCVCVIWCLSWEVVKLDSNLYPLSRTKRMTLVNYGIQNWTCMWWNPRWIDSANRRAGSCNSTTTSFTPMVSLTSFNVLNYNFLNIPLSELEFSFLNALSNAGITSTTPQKRHYKGSLNCVEITTFHPTLTQKKGAENQDFEPLGGFVYDSLKVLLHTLGIFLFREILLEGENAKQKCTGDVRIWLVSGVQSIPCILHILISKTCFQLR